MKKTYPRVRELLQGEVKKLQSVNKVSLKTGLTNNTIGKYLEGISEPQQETLEKLAEYFKTTVPWLRGDDSQQNNASFIRMISPNVRTIPVISMTQAGNDGFWEDAYPVGEGMEDIHCPPQITDPHAFAFKVVGNSMAPRYFSGEIIIIDTTKEVVNNDDAVLRLSDGRVLIKRYRRTNGTILLESYNQAHEVIVVKAEDIKRCYKVVGRL